MSIPPLAHQASNHLALSPECPPKEEAIISPPSRLPVAIGGSSIGAVLSLPPYGCRRRLWYDHCAIEPDYPRETSGAMERGTFGEAAAAAKYAKETGRKLRRINLRLAHQDYPEFTAHVDRHIVAFDDRGPGVLEVKCPGERIFSKVKRDGIAQDYLCQLQWYLFITGWQWGAFAVMNLETWQLIHFDIERDEEIISHLRESALDYLRILENGPEPERLDSKDRRCANCIFRRSCQGAALLALASESDQADDLVSDPSLGAIASEYREAKQIEDEASLYVAEVRERLETAIGTRTAIETTGARIYFRPQPGRVTVDSKGLKSKYPEIYKELARPGKPSRPLRVYPV